jgi:hypothetical protein
MVNIHTFNDFFPEFEYQYIALLSIYPDESIFKDIWVQSKPWHSSIKKASVIHIPAERVDLCITGFNLSK